MKVILLKDLPGLLGKAGDLKVVSDGYGRNYLIPQGFAVLATPSEIHKWEQRRKTLERQREEERKAALAAKEKIESLKMERALIEGEKGEIFGSLRKEDIAEFLKSRGIEVPKTAIELAQPIKKDGEYAVPIALDTDISANLKVILKLSRQP